MFPKSCSFHVSYFFDSCFFFGWEGIFYPKHRDANTHGLKPLCNTKSEWVHLAHKSIRFRQVMIYSSFERTEQPRNGLSAELRFLKLESFQTRHPVQRNSLHEFRMNTVFRQSNLLHKSKINASSNMPYAQL